MTPPATGFGYLDRVRESPGAVLAMAHRGGMEHPDLEGAENSMRAFEHARALGYRYLETDVHASRDGVLFAFHDASLERVAGTAANIADLSAVEIERARIGAGDAVPRLEDVLAALPDCNFNIDLKAPTAVQPLADLIARTGCADRVLAASFSGANLGRFRSLTHGRVATSASPSEVARFAVAPSGRLARRWTRGQVAALQIPHRQFGVPLVTRSLVRRAHAAGAAVHVWTVNDPREMDDLLDRGVDGLITDRTEVLKDVLVRRGQWRDPR